MIGETMDQFGMRRLLDNMATIDQPWVRGIHIFVSYMKTVRWKNSKKYLSAFSKVKFLLLFFFYRTALTGDPQ